MGFLIRNAQALTTFSPAGGQNTLSVLGGHAGAETVLVLSSSF